MARLESKDFVSLVVLSLVVVLSSVIAQGQDYSSRIRNVQADQAYRRLLHAGIFNFGGGGFGSTITPEEKAFGVLLNSENKIALFQRLVNEGNPEGQLYALYGLYLEDPKLFKNAAERLKHDDGPPARWQGFVFIEKGQIRIGEGCVLFEQERRTVIARIASGNFDQTFRASSPRLVF